jgi:protein ImuB
VGIGRSKLLARLAALVGGAGGVLVVGATREKDFLSRLPIEALEPDRVMRERFFLLGLHTAGQLAALTAEDVASRYGHEGIRMHRLARGEDDEPFRPWQPVPEWVEPFDCEGPVDVVERLSFLLCQPMERLLARLAAEGLACQELVAELWVDALVPVLESRRLALALASGAPPPALARTFLDLLRLELEREPLAGPVTRVRLRVAAASAPHAEQGRLFGRKTGVVAALAQTVARLATRLGRGSVFRPELVDTWRPEAAYRATDVGTEHHSGAELPRENTLSSNSTSASTPGLRLFAEPQPATVEAPQGRPAAIVWRHHRHRIAVSTGPWPLSGEWWAAAGYARDYHDVETDAGLRLRLFRDQTTGRWFVHGILG